MGGGGQACPCTQTVQHLAVKDRSPTPGPRRSWRLVSQGTSGPPRLPRATASSLREPGASFLCKHAGFLPLLPSVAIRPQHSRRLARCPLGDRGSRGPAGQPPPIGRPARQSIRPLGLREATPSTRPGFPVGPPGSKGLALPIFCGGGQLQLAKPKLCARWGRGRPPGPCLDQSSGSKALCPSSSAPPNLGVHRIVWHWNGTEN